jgi:hypothetical protein
MIVTKSTGETVRGIFGIDILWPIECEGSINDAMSISGTDGAMSNAVAAETVITIKYWGSNWIFPVQRPIPVADSVRFCRHAGVLNDNVH